MCVIAYSNQTRLRSKRHLVRRLDGEDRNLLTILIEDILSQLEDLEQLYVSVNNVSLIGVGVFNLGVIFTWCLVEEVFYSKFLKNIYGLKTLASHNSMMFLFTKNYVI